MIPRFPAWMACGSRHAADYRLVLRALSQGCSLGESLSDPGTCSVTMLKMRKLSSKLQVRLEKSAARVPSREAHSGAHCQPFSVLTVAAILQRQ